MTTLRGKYIDALIAHGEQRVDTRTRHYVVFTRKSGGYYYLGKSGAFRSGTSVKSSVPLPQVVIDKLCEAP